MGGLRKILRRLKNKSSSLLISLFVSFLIIIVTLASFNFFSIAFSKSNVRNEVIKYNTTNLNNTTERYEKHFEMIKNLMFHFHSSDHVQFLEKSQDKRNYWITYQTYRDIGALLNNHLLYMDNLILYFKKDSFVLDKDTSSNADIYFSKFYSSDNYPVDYWENLLEEKFSSKLLPAVYFLEQDIRNTPRLVGRSFPFLVKNSFQNNFYMIAMINADQLFNNFHNSINDHFHILDPSGQLIFSSGQGSADSIPILDNSSNFTKHGGNYYFHKTGEITGYTYINVIPDSNISVHKRMNMTLVTLLVLSVVISIIASILFSIRLNSPIKNIADSIQHLNKNAPYRSKIKEFDIISSGVTQMMQLNRDIHEDLNKKNVLLKYYAYTSKLKNIHSHIHELKHMVLSKKPYLLILFEFTIKKTMLDKTELKERWTYFIKEFIDYKVSQAYEDSLTFQIEENQVLSIVTAEPNRLNETEEILESMKQVFDHDREHSFFTISVSTIYQDTLDLNAAYGQVLELNKHRSFNDETQIILRSKPNKDSYPKLSSQDMELENNVRAGNLKNVTDWVYRILMHMEKRDLSANQFYTLSEEIINKVLRVLYSLRINTEPLGDPLEQLRDCHNPAELKAFFERFLAHAIECIDHHKDKRDHIIEFVYDYLETHYAEDITLDLVAEKLYISGGYLSTYFKEKTGRSFIDYVNEVRVNKAKALLKNSNLKVQDVAIQSGYLNMNSFHRMFKKFTGNTPNQYRRNADC
ncbi:AraC family transcriptional regulator [Paenibacillus sp. Cedars]|uniref:helix-turn-helix domain-containing protein n=1 Tax=Paenibacillus sp. Cedars TaxID=1980674 RepID=UPI00116308B8|nr:AraC family transcriptional regulator [Paenibacillus sp. Cedars]AWP27716.1 hypothetical protein B9D94_14300 [Paenibacillus sp. Cedars]